MYTYIYIYIYSIRANLLSVLQPVIFPEPWEELPCQQARNQGFNMLDN